MLIFNSLEEMQPYYNKKTKTYEFTRGGKLQDVCIGFNLDIDSHIKARDVDAWDIKAVDIDTWNIRAWNITAGDIDAMDITARDISAGFINACNINAWDISYYSVCCTRNYFKCKSVKGRRRNSKHFCLDHEIEYI